MIKVSFFAFLFSWKLGLYLFITDSFGMLKFWIVSEITAVPLTDK